MNVSPRIGHNLGLVSPEALQEYLSELTLGLAKQAWELIQCADERSEVVDDDTAARAVQLEATMLETWQDLEKLRSEIKKPFIEAGHTVDTHFHQITEPLIGPSPAKKREGAIGDLHARLEAYDIRRRAEIETERQRLEEERIRLEASAAAAEREKAEALVRAHQETTPKAQEEAYRAAAEADAVAHKLADEAAKASAGAAAQVPRPIDSGVGPKATRRANWVPEIIDLPAAITYCLTIPQARAQLELVVHRTYGALVRGGMRDGLPGARIVDQSKLQVRRK